MSNLSFEQIFHKYNVRLIRHAWKLLKDEAIAEDIATEVFIKYLPKQNDFINEFAIKAFLDISTRNACLNYLKHARRLKKAKKLHQYKIEEQEDFVLNEITHMETITEAWSIIESLPESCRRIIIMGYVKGIGNEKIARLLNLSTNTVRNQKVRGLLLIRERYKELERKIIDSEIMTDHKLDSHSKNTNCLAVLKLLCE